MQLILCSMIECSGFYAAWLNAVDSMQRDWMQWIPGSVKKKWNPIECSGFYAAWLNAVDSMKHDWMQWILCSMAQSIPIECSGFHAASLNAEDSVYFGAMDPDCMQWSPCSEAKCIPIEWSGFYAAWPKSSHWMPWIPCSVIECSALHIAWKNASRLNAVDSMQCDWMQWIQFSLKKWNPI